MTRRFSRDSLLALVTVAFSVLCASALIAELWSVPDVLVAAAQG